MTRPVVLGVVGDSAAGKTTLTRGVVRILEERGVAHIDGDDYHRYGRQQRAELGVTPLEPSANHLDILAQDLGHLRNWEPILKPVYNHRVGELTAPQYVRPARFVVAEGLLNFHSHQLREAHDIRVYLAPTEELRRSWKLTRDCTRRGYATHEVFSELDRRERAVADYIEPQLRHADIVVSFQTTPEHDPERLDVHVILRDTLEHPDLSPLLEVAGDGPTLLRREHESLVRIPGDIDPALAAELEEAVWERMRYASHLRAHRLGEFTIGTDLHHSEPLALVQTLLLYHLVSTQRTIRAGVDPHQGLLPRVQGADSVLHG